MYENAAGPGVCRCLILFALVFPAAATEGKRGLRIYPENAAASRKPVSEVDIRPRACLRAEDGTPLLVGDLSRMLVALKFR
jgi:hypothetical protein